MLIERLQRQTGLSKGQVEYYASTASKRYKTFAIPKRSGGQRTIEQPSKQIKALQRWLVGTLLSRMNVHISATAYERNSNIAKNAWLHARSRYTLRMDFSDFFPSFKSHHIISFLNAENKHLDLMLTPLDISFAVRILCRNARLTIGAPSSPRLTNVMMYEFDQDMSKFCTDNGLVYTRYADDIFFSGYEFIQFEQIEEKVRSVSGSYPLADLRVNAIKTAFLSRKRRRIVTGLVLTSDGSVSIGRDLKDKVKKYVYNYKMGRISSVEVKYLRGILGYVKGVEPSFYDTLVRKYGIETVLAITKGVFPT